jgi:hypothetical protein
MRPSIVTSLRRAASTVLAIVFVAGSLAAASPAAAGPRTSGPTAAGDELWRARYNGPGDDFDSANALVASPDGSRVFVTGSRIGTGDPFGDYLTIAYDPSTGAVLRVRRYDLGGLEEAFAIAISTDAQTVYVTGNSWRGSNGDFATIAYVASTGAVRWISRYDGPGREDHAVDVATSPDGRQVFVTGYVDGTGDFNWDFATVAYDAGTGDLQWVRRYDGPAGLGDRAADLAVGPDGTSVFVTGQSEVDDRFEDYATVAYRASTGATLWVRGYDGPAHEDDHGRSIATSPDGSTIFVTGSSVATGGLPDDVLTIAYDSATGAERWTRRSDGGGSDGPADMVISPDGKTLIVGGASEGPSSFDYLTIAFATSTGGPLWARRYDGPAQRDDSVIDVAMAPDGSQVFVTGDSDGMGPFEHTDYATVAYDVDTGTALWARRFAGPSASYDHPHAIDVAPDGGAVYVTGETGRRSHVDFLTIAYEA